LIDFLVEGLFVNAIVSASILDRLKSAGGIFDDLKELIGRGIDRFDPVSKRFPARVGEFDMAESEFLCALSAVPIGWIISQYQESIPVRINLIGKNICC